MRQFKDVLFMGNSNREENGLTDLGIKKLRERLDEGLSILSGIQQPPRPGSEDAYEQYKKEFKEAKKDLKEIAVDITVALLGIKYTVRKNWRMGK